MALFDTAESNLLLHFNYGLEVPFLGPKQKRDSDIVNCLHLAGDWVIQPLCCIYDTMRYFYQEIDFRIIRLSYGESTVLKISIEVVFIVLISFFSIRPGIPITFFVQLKSSYSRL